MGYTTGRRLTYDFIKSQASKFSTKAEFQKMDPSCYTTARVNGILDDVCQHMKPCNFSIPQRICKQIFDNILKRKSSYNNRRVIKPFELDIFYPDLKLAVEYHGRGWHSNEECKIRDKKKEKLCVEKNIKLLIIRENNRRYEEDIKNQIKDNLQLLKEKTKIKISEKDIDELKVDYKDIFSKIIDVEHIKVNISKCKTLKEFRTNYYNDYNALVKLGMLHLVDGIRTIKKRPKNKDKLVEELMRECKDIKEHKDLVKNHHGLYLSCYRAGILKEATKHMVKKREPITEEEIVELSKNLKRRSDLKNKDNSAYARAIKLGLIEKLFPETYRGNPTITEEKIIELAKNYTRRVDFKRNCSSAYCKALKLKLVAKLFPETYIGRGRKLAS